MGQINDSINSKNSILLARNTPVALVVAAGSFVGSFLVDKLLEKDIQVIGVEQIENYQKRNLLNASSNKNFHLILESPDNLDLDLTRLDYIFIVSGEKWKLDNTLELFKKFKCRTLLISSIDLYDGDCGELKELKMSESKIAKFAQEYNLNARVLRLGPIYGPRMDFSVKDPLNKLIQQALSDNLQKDVSLEFSSRALYIDDAVDLIIRTIFAGSTSQKIFDGVGMGPIKVSEIKQVLLDPLWYENRNFIPTSLPPWPTPNLEKTINFLHWKPKAKLVASLKQTLSYFKDNEIEVPKLEEIAKEIKLDEGKKEELEKFKKIDKIGDLPKFPKKEKETKSKQKGKLSFFLPKIYLSLVIALVCFALIWPAMILVGGAISFRYQFDEGLKNLQKGEFEKSFNNFKQAEQGAENFKYLLKTLEPAKKAGIGQSEFEMGEQLTNAVMFSLSSAKSTAIGMQALMQSIKAVTGELNNSPEGYFKLAQIELTAANNNLSKTQAIIKSDEFNKKLPSFLSATIKNYSQKLTDSGNLVSRAQALSIMLPKIIATDGSKDYLILLQNNMELRPTGGFIGSFAKVTFEGGKLKKLAVNDVYAIDGGLKIHVEPPKEIKEDLNQKDWYLRDSNWEPDFPTSARQAEWFYAKETGGRVEGVIALDISAIEELLGVIGPLNLPDYNENITAENLFAKAVTHAEVNFFPGSQAKKSFLTALSNGVFNKIFFLPQNNWPGVIAALGRSLEQKHISVYLDDPKMFSFILSQNWGHVLPRASKENQNQDFLSLVESNLGANKVNYYLTRNYNLQTMVGKDGEVRQRLRINYTNRSPSDVFPGGKYKNRMRIYLPFGSKLIRALWGESEITKNVSSFVDYGRSGYSLLLELAPKEQKTLVLDYTTPIKLEFNGSKATYRLDIIKQAGTLKDPIEWTITYPINFKLSANQAKMVGPQEQTIQTDLSIDRSFEVEFTK